ncbi:GMC family oxidoreductase [Nocardia stercoris]|uniref:Glucose-methanol-choline oxidoreductase n=1 Tax=Nocardia stercoris TaxID=2483361 RepID=A0A3M2L5B6_9NOCA|nr:GMC family oxidoreductase N-terminal domain-containing protein [Nocardia stercoris]RMI32584.1 glucose-methanol-choline oxidoreductase [Nocardia stercoris]
MTYVPPAADYVVVGTGSSGAVVAARLSERSQYEVVALEAGPVDKNQFIHIPAAFSKLFHSDLDWKYLTTPQPQLHDRQILYPRGKMLGGSSSMNAMMWVRGFAADYDDWADAAGEGWGFESVVEYFRRIEAVEGTTEPDQGTDGPLIISRQRNPNEWTARFLEAVQKVGFQLETANIQEPEGFTETMVNQRNGSRWSTADAYLKPAKGRPNLQVITGALVTRVIFEGTRAVGVEYRIGDEVAVVRAKKEVVLCGGAINSPQLLQLSGIGAPDLLAEQGIPVVAAAPEVGANLSDHLTALLGYGVAGGTLADAEKPLQLINYLTRKRGMLTSNVGEAYGFVRSRKDLELPDLELVFGPAPFYEEGIGTFTGHGIALGTVLVKPESRGTVTLRSADPAAAPLVDPRYLSDPGGVDRAAMLAGLRLVHKILHTEPLGSKLGPLLQPKRAQAELDDLLEEALTWYSHTLYHPTGTCRMGTDAGSVVDPELRVRGVEGLRVADASVMPTIIRGHTHAPAVVIGEKAADLIAG